MYLKHQKYHGVVKKKYYNANITIAMGEVGLRYHDARDTKCYEPFILYLQPVLSKPLD
jgi:hypothetical protein